MKEQTRDMAVSTGIGIFSALAATWVMTEFQMLMSKMMKSGSSDDQKDDRKQEAKGSSEEQTDEPATAKIADRISHAILNRDLKDEEKQTAGQFVHYGFGTSLGLPYGVLSSLSGQRGILPGLGFGALVWLIADEIAVPAAGLSKKPTETPASTHLYALGAHLVYGASLGLMHQLGETLMERGPEMARSFSERKAA